MQNPGGPYSSPYPTYPYGARPHPRRWLYIALAVAVLIVAVAIFLVILTPGTFGYHPSSPFGIGPFGLFGGFFLVLIVLFIVLWVVRIAWWTSRPRGGYGQGGGRRYGAFAIARERYARGEITREQYEQIMQDLQRRPGYPP